ncbi:MAG: hypothetical protein Q7U57_09625 [Methylovulum sp.]|nr:hypothetical protein [Methylovulum sp.]
MAKELHRHGMIDGLRGLSIELTGRENPQEQDQHRQEQTECRQCRYFLKDLIGDGTGIGKCAKNAWKTVLWPNTAACQDYEARS